MDAIAEKSGVFSGRDAEPWRRVVIYIVVSAALLIPCFWQSRIQAGDLSSHIYNTWLAGQIEHGQAPGLAVVPQFSNILFDLILAELYDPLGPGPAQRIAVSLAVLNFVWGAFYFISIVSGRRPWFLMPCLAMLAYGWVFHMGLFNFYLALGLCWWALGLLWQGGFRAFWAIPLLGLAYVAHGLPVAWAVALEAYILASRKTPHEWRWLLPATAAAVLIAAHFLLLRQYASRWSPAQVLWTTGADQVFVFGTGFLMVAVLLLIVWLMLAMRLSTIDFRSARLGPPAELALLTAIGISLVPGGITLPHGKASLVYIPERMSLGVAILLCAVLASAPPSWVERASSIILAAAFFGLLYQKTLQLNRLEDEVETLVRHVPPMQPVIAPLIEQHSRVPWLAHMVDRACIGRCYSYANYEPSTDLFRVRVLQRSSIVVDNYDDSYDMQTGAYRPREGDPPIYQISHCGEGLCVTLLNAAAR